MSVEKNRLLSLIDFSQQSARLRGKPASTVAAHGLFALYEQEIHGLPGIRLNAGGPETDVEIWLSVERLRETKPPDVGSALLLPWVQMSQGPIEEPRLRQTTVGATLIAAGTHCPSSGPLEKGKHLVDPEAVVILSDYESFPLVQSQFAVYLDTKWRPWAGEEKLRRRTIRVYSQLFTLKQQLEGGIVEAQLELVWGVGLGIWHTSAGSVSYPLIGRLVEISLDPSTADLEIRPRDVDARIEVDWYASVDNPGVGNLEKAAREFFGRATTTFSPFDRGTFEPLLRTAATNLDAQGIYWPNEVPAEDRALPRADDRLKVTDTWVCFARPRSNNLFLQDLEKLKARVHETDDFPPAVAAVVTDPDTTSEVEDLPSFRGVSASYPSEKNTNHQMVRDLYFPKAFNDEQVRIIQLLDFSDGVVVQGPPGTGKTHTIANVICHYLAEGKRVLVTSMKDPALAVLQEQLPDEIRPLAISLLTSEQDGMKQFEHAIQKIASEVQSLDRTGTTRAIAHLADSIDVLHGKLARIDGKIAEWATRNIAKIALESEEIDPQDAAREVVEHADQFQFLPDALGITPDFATPFQDSDVVRLRDARRALGDDLDYLNASLPQLVEFPDSKALLEVHQDLSRFEMLTTGIETGEVPALADSSSETLALANHLLAKIQTLQRQRDELLRTGMAWTATMRERLWSSSAGNLQRMVEYLGDGASIEWPNLPGEVGLLRLLETLGTELEDAMEWRNAFLQRPVTTEPGVELDAEIIEGVRNLAEGRKPFGLMGVFGRSVQKKQLDDVRVLGRPPADAESWKHVAEHLALLKRLRELTIRWNALAPELQIQGVTGNTSEGAIAAAQAYATYVKVKATVSTEAELCVGAATVFPSWSYARDIADDPRRLMELDRALRHHMAKNRLANVWAHKEHFQKVLDGRTGRVVQDIRRFLSNTLGNPDTDDAEMQGQWTATMTELSRVLGLGTHLAVVDDGCSRAEASGAPKYAAALKRPLEGAFDGLLPDNFRSAWRLRRLATHLESIDGQQELKGLAKDRHDVEADLTRAYREIVVKRTWLKLAENASPSIRAALQAYLNAVQKIGKGTGKRAVRYRQDARNAATQANPAVPCWIMPHYRVSESLPAELGCFDLVVIDEASQSDLTALPSLLRARKVLIVGDDKQVSPEGVGLEEDKIRSLMSRFLDGQVETYRAQMSPERSIYDLFKVVFARSAVMLKEHFRCVGPIIEYSKREFYNHELRPLRMPRASERLDPPLIDVIVEDGFRKGDINQPEARFIVDEIKAIASDIRMKGRSIGVVSLLADKQALLIWDRLTDELGPELMQRHRVACGDARTFQGKERDIMFLSMVSAPNEVGAPLSRDTFAQRFNVAASRARDRMYLVRSVGLEHLSEADRLRRGLITHFAAPFGQDEGRVEDLRKLCESPFEREMYDELTRRGYWVTPQVRVGQYRIDMVIEGHNDARLAIECDGDKYHGADKWADDIQRQRVLERAGWSFWRCFASAFIRRRKDMLDDVVKALTERGIEPIGAEGAPRSVHTEHRVGSVRLRPTAAVSLATPGQSLDNAQSPLRDSQASPPPPIEEPSSSAMGELKPVVAPMYRSTGDRGLRDANLSFGDYVEYKGPPAIDPRTANKDEVWEGLVKIVAVEGPLVAKRAYDIYLRSCGIQRMGHELKSTMNRALSEAIRHGRIASKDEAGKGGILFSVVRLDGSPPIKLRSRGPRSFEEIPPSEIQAIAKYLVNRENFQSGSDEHLRAILARFDLTRLTTQVGASLLEILERPLPHVDEFLIRIKE